jgi:hypothetical protein
VCIVPEFIEIESPWWRWRNKNQTN